MLSVIMVAVSTFVIASKTTDEIVPFNKIVLPAGTLVVLETNEKVFSDEMTQGQNLKFKVKTDVRVNGKVVIKTGVIALGRVKSITKTTYNFPERITIELTSVQTVDGQQIALDGNEQTFKGKFTGEGTTIDMGETITATVMNDVIVDI